MSDDKPPMQATPASTLEQHIMDPRVAKSEAEWWASREITRLRAENIHLRRAGMDRPSAELHEAALAELRVENDHLKQARSDALAGGDALREEITRLRAGLQKIVEGDGFWDAPSIARDLLEGKDVT